jgi:cobalt transporter subunit CbtA
MIGRVFLAALLAGIAAGLLLGIFTETRLVPLILQAETFETEDVGHGDHSHDATALASSENWAPSEGWERTGFTLVTSMLAGAGFAAVLAGLSFVLAIPITRRNGLIWGLCGFLAVSLAPAAGLPPSLPGMAEGALAARQVWWIATILCTGTALWLLTQRRESWMVFPALLVGLAPHVIGAPVILPHETAVGAMLVQHFVANSLAVNALFWILLGVFLGFALEKFEKDAAP